MTWEDATIFGLDGPKTSLVVHLGPGVFTHPTNQIWVSGLSWDSRFWCHCGSAAATSVSETLKRLCEIVMERKRRGDEVKTLKYGFDIVC